MRARALFLALVVLTACATEPAPAPSLAPIPPPAPEPTPAVSGLTLRGAVAGDRGCVLTVEGAEDGVMLAIPELCPGGPADISALIGQRVTLVTETATVAAAECQGNPQCGDVEQVEVVRAVRAEGS